MDTETHTWAAVPNQATCAAFILPFLPFTPFTALLASVVPLAVLSNDPLRWIRWEGVLEEPLRRNIVKSPPGETTVKYLLRKE